LHSSPVNSIAMDQFDSARGSRFCCCGHPPFILGVVPIARERTIRTAE
jgi:hypothetical protein